MSTKRTILCGKNWHLYKESLDGSIWFERDCGSSCQYMYLMSEEEWSESEEELLVVKRKEKDKEQGE